jgi:hypothetical protein
MAAIETEVPARRLPTFRFPEWDKSVCLSSLLVIISAAAWSFALWPGSVTHDTLHLLHQVEANVYTDYFPILNGVLFRILVVTSHSLVPYVLAQLAFCVGTTIYVLATLRRLGAPAVVILLAGAFIAVSVPIGAYWTMTFKDIPCNFAIVALSIQVFAAYFTRRLNITIRFILSYVLFLTIGAFLRQGWQVLLLVIPVLLLIPTWRTLKRHEIQLLLAIPLILFLIFQWIVPRSLGVTNPPEQMTKIRTGIFIQPYVAIVTAREGYSALHKEVDDELLRDIFVDPSKAGGAYNAVNVYPILLLFKGSIDPGVPMRLARRTATLCMLNLGLCLRDRVAMLFGTLQSSTTSYAMVYYNLANPRHASLLVGPLEYMASTIQRYHIAAPADRAQSFARRILDWTDRAPVKALVWNAIPQFMLIFFGFFWYKRFPATAAACAVILIMTALQFAVINANDFRYGFFVYLGGIFVIPMMCAEYIAKRKNYLK